MITATDSGARFEINPCEHPRDIPYLGCVTVWGLLILGFSIASLFFGFWFGAIFGGVLFLAIIPYTLTQRNRFDVLHVESDVLFVRKGNPEDKGIKLLKRNALELTIEHVENSDSVESTSTLNLWDMECGYRRRTILGLFISEEAKDSVAKDLVDFLRENGFKVDYSNKVGNRRQNKRMESNG